MANLPEPDHSRPLSSAASPFGSPFADKLKPPFRQVSLGSLGAPLFRAPLRSRLVIWRYRLALWRASLLRQSLVSLSLAIVARGCAR